MEKLPTVDLTPQPQNRGKFYVRLIEGQFQRWRRWISWPLLAVFFATVWLQRHGQPVVQFDLAGQRLHIWGLELAWFDLPLLAGLLIVAACLLLVMAVVWGRVWCGFACPQSVWTWIFIRIEQWLEGPAHRRRKQDQEVLRGWWLGRRLCKHLLWLLVAALTALTFTGYFMPIREMLAAIAAGQLAAGVWGWLLVMTLLTYLNAGLVREQICLHACPYSRFQAVMFDRYTRTVTYDVARGEPRGKATETAGKRGDCVDCQLCVQVCPVGIDIRQGLQAACIDCGACIDACDKVMNHLQRPTGLIRFTSAAGLAGLAERLWRPRLGGYLLVLMVSLAATGYGFMHKSDLLVEVQKDRTHLYLRMTEPTICNLYQIRVEPVNPQISTIEVSVAGLSQARLFGRTHLAAADSGEWMSLRVCVDNPVAAKTAFRFRFTGLGDRAGVTGKVLAKTVVVEKPSWFFAPVN